VILPPRKPEDWAFEAFLTKDKAGETLVDAARALLQNETHFPAETVA
jgi:hypothetical protein